MNDIESTMAHGTHFIWFLCSFKCHLNRTVIPTYFSIFFSSSVVVVVVSGRIGLESNQNIPKQSMKHSFVNEPQQITSTGNEFLVLIFFFLLLLLSHWKNRKRNQRHNSRPKFSQRSIHTKPMQCWLDLNVNCNNRIVITIKFKKKNCSRFFVIFLFIFFQTE